MSTNTGGPRCPNHRVTLERTNTKGKRTNTKGIGICPVSGCRFSYKSDDASKEKKLHLDVYGHISHSHQYTITPLDGEDG